MNYKKVTNYNKNVVYVYGPSFLINYPESEGGKESKPRPTPPPVKKQKKPPPAKLEIDGLSRVPINEFTIVPIKDVVRCFNTSNQTTLTKIFGCDTLSSSDTDSDSKCKPNKRPHPARIITPSMKKQAKPKVNPDWGGRRKTDFDATLAHRGDLLTSTSKELNHPPSPFW